MTAQDLFNILLEDKPSITLRECEEEVFKLIPELKKCKGFNQNSIWHNYDVYEHILHVVDYVPNNLYLRIAALFHDVGKPATYVEDEKGGHFPKHWEESVDIFRNFMTRNNCSDELFFYINYLIMYHDLSGDKLPQDVLFLFGIEGIQQLYELKRADLLAQNPEMHYLMEDYNKQEQELKGRCQKRINNQGGLQNGN